MVAKGAGLMKRWMPWWVTAIIVAAGAVWVYSGCLSTPAQVRAAGSAFMRTAVTGDEAAIRALLAPDAPITAADVASLYSGHLYNNFKVYPIKALPNGSGVTWLPNTSTLDLSGNTGTTEGVTLALKRVNGQWLIFQAGTGFSL